jgi:putative SOS response-associated peptidase YedK
MKGGHQPGRPSVRRQRFDPSLTITWLKPETAAWCRPIASGIRAGSEPQTKKIDVVWFALNDHRPLFAFAGIWTEFKGDRGGTKSKPMLALTRSTVS